CVEKGGGVLNPVWGDDERAACPVSQTLGQTAKFRQTAPEIGVSPGFATHFRQAFPKTVKQPGRKAWGQKAQDRKTTSVLWWGGPTDPPGAVCRKSGDCARVCRAGYAGAFPVTSGCSIRRSPYATATNRSLRVPQIGQLSGGVPNSIFPQTGHR